MTDEPATSVTPVEVRRICGDVSDWKLGAILDLQPTLGDIVAAVAWANGEDEFGEQPRPLEGLAAQVYDLLTSDEAYGEER
jgi:hypothetical protein